MPGFRAGDVVRVPFPCTDRSTRQHRPALVVSNGGIGPGGSLLWVVMVTSAANRGWADDIDIGPDHQAVGLPAPSIIRICKIATIEARHAAVLGRISPALLERVHGGLGGLLPPA